MAKIAKTYIKSLVSQPKC